MELVEGRESRWSMDSAVERRLMLSTKIIGLFFSSLVGKFQPMDEKSRPTRAVSECEMLRVVDRLHLTPISFSSAGNSCSWCSTRGAEEGKSQCSSNNSSHPTVLISVSQSEFSCVPRGANCQPFSCLSTVRILLYQKPHCMASWREAALRD